MTENRLKTALTFDANADCYYCEGAWSIQTLSDLEKTFEEPLHKATKVSGAKLSALDTAGAFALQTLAKRIQPAQKELVWEDFSEEHTALFSLLKKQKNHMDYKSPAPLPHSWLYALGEESVKKYHQAKSFMRFLKELGVSLAEKIGRLKGFHPENILSNIDSTGITALPIVGLLSCLIGVVLAYQMGLQLQTYGANSFIAYLSGMAIFREFAPLMTAVIVAGRTSSAFTAQLGSMVVNEEIDALKTMGLSPIEWLVLPKLWALVLVFPILIFWSDLFGTMGAMWMSKWMLNMEYADFLVHLKESVGLKQFMLGLYKAPVFALIIGLVGCFQGFSVARNANSIGQQTTKSVVQALFLIIIADAIYSIIYSKLGV